MKSIIEAWVIIIFFAVIIFVFDKISIALFILVLLWIGSKGQIELIKKLINKRD